MAAAVIASPSPTALAPTSDASGTSKATVAPKKRRESQACVSQGQGEARV